MNVDALLRICSYVDVYDHEKWSKYTFLITSYSTEFIEALDQNSNGVKRIDIYDDDSTYFASRCNAYDKIGHLMKM